MMMQAPVVNDGFVQEALDFRQLADRHGNKPAAVMADGSPGLTFRELDAQSAALARMLAGAGLVPGDRVAILLPNSTAFVVAMLAAFRSGLVFTPLNYHLGMGEVLYVLNDCKPRLLLTDLFHMPRGEQARGLTLWVSCGLSPGRFRPLDRQAPDPRDYSEQPGVAMLYSSGTGGQPRGVVPAAPCRSLTTLGAGERRLRHQFDIGEKSTFLVTGPLYHVAGLGFTLAVLRAGGTCIFMDRFEPQLALDLIAWHRVTAAWMVPTMLIGLLRLPVARREEADLSSLTHLIHGAAPCAIETKQAIMDWLGFIVHEIYGATEGVGFLTISPNDWLRHPGSVGRADPVRIVGENGRVLAAGEVGEIYFTRPIYRFSYLNDPARTARAFNADGWATIGDMGYVDEDGWLYVVDRKSHVVHSSGHRVFPQETESVLAAHGDVADVAVIGVPDTDRGEALCALVVPLDERRAGARLEHDLMVWCAERLDRHKCPATVEFVRSLPRLPSGKMRKRELRDRYRFRRA